MDLDFVRRNDGRDVLSFNFAYLRTRYVSGVYFEMRPTPNSIEAAASASVNKRISARDEKTLNQTFLSDGDWPAVLRWMRIVGGVFHEVCFSVTKGYALEGFPRFNDVIDFVNKILPCLKNVRILYLGQLCYDSTLTIIGENCQNLEKLVTDECSVSDNGLKCLCPFLWEQNQGEIHFPRLKFLSVSSVNNIDAGIEYVLINMLSLEEVVYNNLPNILYKLYENDQERKYNITSLHLNDIRMLQHIFNYNLNLFSDICPHINKLTLTILSKEHLHWCSFNLNFPELQDLNLNNLSDGKLDLKEFLQSKGGILQSLSLKNFNFSISDLVQNCPRLEILYLEDITFQSDIVSEPLLSLKELFSEDFDFGKDLTCESVIGSLSLSYLKFTNCYIDIEILQSLLSACSILNTLSVDCCDNIIIDDIENLRESFLETKIIFTKRNDDSTVDDSDLQDSLDNNTLIEHRDSDDSGSDVSSSPFDLTDDRVYDLDD